jgi:hypothetical protein
MDSSTILTKRFLSINPVNSGEGVYGYSNGLPQLIFNLGNTGLLQTSEVRLSFNLRIVETGTTVNNVDPAKQVSVGFFNGAESVMDEIEISSTNYGRSLERIDHYARMNASVNSALHSKSQYDSHLNHEQGSCGVGITTRQQLDEELLSDAQHFVVNGEVKHQGIIMRNDVQGRECSMRVVCGLFLSQQEISLNDVGGLTLRIKLAPNEAVLSDIASITGEAAATPSDFHYEIINPRLIAGCVMETPMAQQQRLANQTPTLPFLSYHSFYNNIISTDFQALHKINAAAVISVFSNFIPSKNLNNYNAFSDAQMNPNIQELVFQKDGMRVPLQYELRPEQDRVLTDDDEQPSTFPAVLYHYLSAWGAPADRLKSSINPLISAIRATNDEFGCFGIGASYDTEHQGISGKVANLGFQIKSKLLDPDAGDNTTQTPYSAFSYYLCKNELIVNRGQGVAVVN